MSRDGWIGVGLLFICGWLYTALDRIPANPLVPIGPNFYPWLLLLIILALALALVLQDLLARDRKKERPSITNHLQEYQPTLLSFCLFLLYVLLLPKLGFLFATIL